MTLLDDALEIITRKKPNQKRTNKMFLDTTDKETTTEVELTIVEHEINVNLVISLWNKAVKASDTDNPYWKSEAYQEVTFRYNHKLTQNVQVFKIAGVIRREIEKDSANGNN
ncbi:MAG: hypothetical protein COA78_22055 [Blastopirellula sp.]|nr:MAG: hypothetical protein COA78_22055 [Blastopirellula sp.]